MDTVEFVKNFLNKHKNSYTHRLITNLQVNPHRFSPACMIIDRCVSWGCSKEGFYYYYFLQVRLLLGLTQALYEDGELTEAKQVLVLTKKVMNYSHTYIDFHCNGSRQISRKFYCIYRNYYNKLYNNLKQLLNEKSC